MPPKKDSKENSNSPNRRKRPTTSTSTNSTRIATPASGHRSSPSNINRSRRSSAARDYHRDRAAAAAAAASSSSQTGPASPSPTQRQQPPASSPRQRLRRRPQLQHSNESSSHSQTQSRSQAHHRGNTSTRTNTNTNTNFSSTRSTRSHSNSSSHSLQTTVTTASNATNASNATSATTATNASRDLFLRYASKVRPRPSSKNPDGELIMSDWCTIESDPGVFTSLIESFGVENAQVTELWSLDDDSLKCILDDYGKVHGLVFLFKWQRESSNSTSSNNGNKSEEDETVGERKPLSPEEVPEDLFFAKQVTTNACATQAILSILLNAKSDGDANTNANTDGTSLEAEQSTLKLGEMLTALKSFTTSFPADLKGEAIGASDEIRSAHNSFARKEAFLVDDSKKRIAGDDDDVFHFIAYVPHSDGNVYELDGLQPGPISVGSYNISNDTTISDGDDDNKRDFAWIATARTAIQARIEKYAASEIKFNLMALTADKRNVIQSKLATLLSSGVVEDDERIQNYNVQLVQEEDRREQWKQENERRRHNYIPFCMELIRALAMSGTLQDCTRKANEKVQAARLKQRLG